LSSGEGESAAGDVCSIDVALVRRSQIGTPFSLPSFGL
jgi:hypothetical protein